MIEDYPWYRAVQTDVIEQGDFFPNCPFYRLSVDGAVDRDRSSVIVMSHSCDLVQAKVDVVQVCPYYALDDFGSEHEYFRGKRGREDLRRGNVPGYHLLNRCDVPEFSADFFVVDFRSLFGVPFETLCQLAAVPAPRLRLLPPYREHLAQAFARFFMRVGLPIDVPPFR